MSRRLRGVGYSTASDDYCSNWYTHCELLLKKGYVCVAMCIQICIHAKIIGKHIFLQWSNDIYIHIFIFESLYCIEFYEEKFGEGSPPLLQNEQSQNIIITCFASHVYNSGKSSIKYILKRRQKHPISCLKWNEIEIHRMISFLFGRMFAFFIKN